MFPGKKGWKGSGRGDTSSPGTKVEQGVFSGSQFFSLPQTTRQPGGGNLEEEDDEREVTNSSNPQPTSSFLLRFITNYTQPREEPSQSLAESHRTTTREDGWTAYIGRTVIMREVEEVDSRRRRTEEKDPNTETRVWHRLSSRPKNLDISNSLSRGGRIHEEISAGIKQDVQPFDVPGGLSGDTKQEVVTPAATPIALDAERLELEKVFMDNASKNQAESDAFAAGDGEAELAHLLHSILVSVDRAAELETIRRAAETNNDVLLRKRRAFAQGASSFSAMNLM
jgi:hypothetical protein